MGKLRNAAKKFKNAITNGLVHEWDMTTKEAREKQVRRDYEFAKTEKGETTQKFIQLNNYYNNKHYTKQQIQELASNKGWNFTPPVLPDPFIQVESQVVTDIPQFQFKGRDEDLDSLKAKEREQVVEYIVYNNKIEELNLDNERALNEIGNAFFKVAFDKDITGPGFIGDIVVGNPDAANIFPDPSAYEIDDCEWIIYAFRMHRRKARRIYGGIIDEITNDNLHTDTEIYENANRTIDDDTLQVIEYWYRDDEGDIACSVQINNIEVKHIPKYWISTAKSGNKMYPFVKYGKIPVRKSFWDKGEIEMIVDLVDAADREFITAIMNDMFMSNDIVLYEEGALPDGASMPNNPGAAVKVSANKINAVRRLGGISNASNAMNVIEFIHSKIEETNGNFASSQGLEPARVTTSTGIAQLNERADARKSLKMAGRLKGYARLYELIDWTALEFYNQDRIILIRGKKDGEQDQSFTFNSGNHMQQDPITSEPYYPKIDVEIQTGEGIKQSKSFTLAATQELAKMPINPVNKGIVQSIIDILDLPNKKEVKDAIDQAFAPATNTPQDKPKVSINYKDLPPEGQIQAAGEAGIQIQNPIPNQIPGQTQGQEIPGMEDLQDYPPELIDFIKSQGPEFVNEFMQLGPEEKLQMLEQMLGGGDNG